MNTSILFKETDHLVKLWHYLFFLIPIYFDPQSLLIIPVILIFLTIIRYSPIKLINTKIDSHSIKYSTAQLIKRGYVTIKEIENFKLIEFEKMFDFKFVKLYKYCNGNKVSHIKYGVELTLTDGRTVIIPTKKPKELLAVIEKLHISSTS